MLNRRWVLSTGGGREPRIRVANRGYTRGVARASRGAEERSWASTLSLPSWSRWVGAGFGIVAVPLFYWMFSSLGKNVTDTVAIRREHSLVTYGPYRWVRHPMYSIALLFFAGFSLLSANWFIGLTVIVGLSILVARTSIEERKLIEEFGDEYREYMKRTGRFFPRLMRSGK
ncbi:MAG: isoprenylcysteine carboxylmethyltransferase family protein [Gemmatimonadetes bacterium]|nr:isoprenylcysteine carboxylmethyltransferase family protein [Gemmatimonadota bacterium]